MDTIVKNAVRDGYDFVPDKVIMGKFSYKFKAALDPQTDYSTICAVPSCKHKYKSWCNSYKFKRLTKYCPCVQRNAVAEVEKAALNVCEEIANVPTSGFRIVSFDDNLYHHADKKYQYCGEAVIYDPRGFAVEISKEDLAKMIAENHGNMSSYMLKDVEYVYCSSDTGMTLIPWKSDQCQQIVEHQKSSLDEDGNPLFISPSKLQEGHAYITSDCCSIRPGIYIYAGKHDTYSPREVNDSLLGECTDGGYSDHSHYCYLDTHPYNNSGEPSCKNSYVFFMAKELKLSSSKRHLSKPTLFDKIVVQKAVAKEFMKEVPLDPTWTMPHDSSKPMNYNAIQEFIAESPYFTKIDVSHISFAKTEKVDFKNFVRLFASNDSRWEAFELHDDGSNPDKTKMVYPYSLFNISRTKLYQDKAFLSPDGMLSRIYVEDIYGDVRNPYVPYSSNDSLDELKSKTFSCNVHFRRYTFEDFCFLFLKSTRLIHRSSNEAKTGSSTASACKMSDFSQSSTLEEIYNAIRPIVPIVYFENGRKVGQFHVLWHLKSILIRASLVQSSRYGDYVVDFGKVRNDISKSIAEME